MPEFHFLRPLWLLAFPIVLLLVWLCFRRQFGNGSWTAVIADHLLPHVVRNSPSSHRFRRTIQVASVAAASLACMALAGPTWDRLPAPTIRSAEALVIALDLSRSMDAADLAPSRLGRAKLKLLDLLERRPNGQTALIVFSAHAFTVTPLTDDTDTISALLGSLSSDIMPSRGSYPEAALRKASALLDQAGVPRGDILLVTDSEVTDPMRQVVADLVAQGHRLSVLGVGTRSGGPIPKDAGGFLTDRAGNVVVTRLRESELAQLARNGGGRYASLTVDSTDIERLLQGVSTTGSAAPDELPFETTLWKDRGPYLVLLLLPLALLAFRRGLVVGTCLIFLLPDLSHAGFWDDLWMNRDQQGREAMTKGEHAVAAELFEDSRWRAAAHYRSGDYRASAQSLQDLATSTDFYNRGNALARSGDFPGAIAAYDQALALDPDHEDAIFNRELLLENMPPQQQQGGGQGDNSDDNSEQQQQSQQQQQQNGEQQQSSQGGAEQGEEEGQQSQPTASDTESLEEWASEQAADQWLRRIPDDPGGLLRRKFRYQYQRLGRDQDGNDVWPGDEEKPY